MYLSKMYRLKKRELLRDILLKKKTEYDNDGEPPLDVDRVLASSSKREKNKAVYTAYVAPST